MASSRVPRPGRALAVLLLALVAAYGGMFLSGITSPRLGLDLQGGTSVILQARTSGGQAPSKASLDQAVNIIRNRVNGLGVAEAEVTTQGSSNIVVSVPGATSRQVIDLVGQTAQLRFRQVLAEGAGAPLPAPTGSPTAPATPGGTPGASPTPLPASPTPAVTTPPARPRAVPPALAAAPSPTTPAAGVPAAPSPTPSPTAPPGGAAALINVPVPAAVQQEFATLDCSNPKNRQGGGNDQPTEVVVACDRTGAAKYVLGPTLVDGTEVRNPQAGLRPNTSEWIVTLSFTSQGTKQFGDATTLLVSQTPPRNAFAIVLDGVVVSAPTVNTAIPGGQAEITGSFTQQSANDLANVLRYGSLPLAFDRGEVTSISPTLGRDQLVNGLLAGAIGLALVVVYSLLYYRGLGVVSILSLAVAGAATYASVVLLGKGIGFALTLAGVAGLIVAIGITADSFVVFFERLRDELREGKSLRLAVEHGWARARRTILVADAVSFLAAAVLYYLAVGNVKGFAFTLGLTTLIDVVVVFLFTRPLVTLLARRRFFAAGHPLSGLDPQRLGAKQAAPGWRRRPAPARREA